MASLVLLASVGAGGVGARQATGTRASISGINVFAAASLTDVFPAIDSGATYSFAGSNALATQIANGAPADVFASANTSIPATLYAQGLVEKPVNFTRNTLVVVVPTSNPAGIQSVYDLAKPGVKIVVANPSVPVGSYTLQVLGQMGLTAKVTPNFVSQETDVRSVLAKVQLGQADAGFVYSTDARTVGGQVKVISVPAWAQPKVTYAMAVVSKSPNQQAAQAFVDEVLSKAGQAKMAAYGFLPLTAPVPAIARISPRSGKPGTKITISGSNLGSTTVVRFAGANATFRVVSPTKITVVVPARAGSGAITVINPAGTAQSASFAIR